MLDRYEINKEIARLEYEDSSYPNYAKLADLYAIRDRMDREEGRSVDMKQEIPYSAAYSSAPAPDQPDVIELYGDSEFLRAVEGRHPEKVWAIIDDLMDTLHTVNPRVYLGVMRKINGL